mgnify:CR=1 FL=1
MLVKRIAQPEELDSPLVKVDSVLHFFLLSSHKNRTEGRSEIILEDTYPPTATLGLLFIKGAGSITLVYPAPGHFRANSVYHASEPSPGVSS